MKRILHIILPLCVATTMMAIPAKRGQWRTITLNDGSRMRVELRGDENLSFYQSADGSRYVADPQTGFYKPADMPALGKLAARRSAKTSLRRLERRKAIIDGTHKDFKGPKKGLMILVNFTNKKLENGHDAARFRRLANEENYHEGNFKGSVSDYFKAQSGGRFELNFDVVGPIELAHDVAYYGGNDDAKAPEMIIEACKGAANLVDFTDYDWDNDGEVDQVYVLYAGLGEADGGAAETVWPHEWSLDEAQEAAEYYGQTVDYSLTLDGVKINTYACGNELAVSDGYYDANDNFVVTATQLGGIGTICHEFSHCLGLPDTYDTSANGSNFGMSCWDIMAGGSYNGDGFQPAGYTSYEKWVSGWLTPIELGDRDTTITNMKALSEGGEAYIIRSRNTSVDEYYLLENRQKTNWDESLYGEGLLVLHVDYDKNAWLNNEVNNTAKHQRMTIIPADNSAVEADNEGYLDTDELAGDPFPYNGLDSLTNNSRPAATLYNNNADGRKLMSRGLLNITQNNDGTISFNYQATANENNGGQTPSGDMFFYESFDQCDSAGGNDNQWSGQIANGQFSPDNEGWTNAYVTDNSACFGAKECAKFGSGKKDGSVLSPSFTVSGDATMTFKAAPWGQESTTLRVEVLGTDGTNAVVFDNDINNFQLSTEQWTSCTLDFNHEGVVKLAFYPSKNRFFLDEVSVQKPVSSGISEVERKPLASPMIYNISGIAVGKDFNALPKGIYIVNGKKIIK